METDLRRRLAIEHGVAVIGARVGAQKSRWAKHVERDVVSVRPHAQLGIIVEVGILERVAIVSAGGIGRSRNRNALQERRRAHHELRKYPAISQLVIGDDRIAIVVAFASAAKAFPESIPY